MIEQHTTVEGDQEFIKTLLVLFSSFAKDIQETSPDVAKTATEAIKKLRAFSNRLEADPFVAGFIGLSNVGKSTL
jgi:ribosome biogenesis GTPase A